MSRYHHIINLIVPDQATRLVHIWHHVTHAHWAHASQTDMLMHI